MKYVVGLILSLFLFFTTAQTTANDLKSKAKESLDYAKKNKMDTTMCILVDFSIHSGNKRMFVYDFQKDSIILEGLCTHGCGAGEWANGGTPSSPVFSNVPDSHCSSVGKYKIGDRAYSNWGIHIKYSLHGLEATNNNAYKRYVVLHSWEIVSDTEVYPNGSPESWGCPAVSDKMMEQLDILLKASTKPVLLWIYV